MQEYTRDEGITCDGCGLPIEGEGISHASALGMVLVAHDFTCLRMATQQTARRLVEGYRATL